MKISVHTYKKINLQYIADNNAIKDFCINKKRTLILPDDTKMIRFKQPYSKQNTNVFGFVFLAIISAFLETQKTFEKREFVSFYDFAEDCLISDFSLNTNGESEINIFSKKAEFAKFNYTYWFCENKNVKIINEPMLEILQEKLLELIAFWTVVLFIPIILLSIVTAIVFFKTGNIFDLGIVLIGFLTLVFVSNIVMFLIQYKTIIKFANSIN